MKKVSLVLAALSASAFVGACSVIPRPGPVGNRSVPAPAKSVDLSKYMGRWYEQFRYEASFQKGFEAVSADYILNEDGTVRVVNRGMKGGMGGTPKESVGRAKVVDSGTNAKLKVSFFGPFYGDYWVLDHDANYSWSIVGEPSGRYLWALTREEKPGTEMVAMLEARVVELGYDRALIRRTQH